ncbi:hypothetical protein SKAU_G00332740 [Synaphobranchus kaupii]|uniref:SGNH hydrolase-type esterase domain-containing protein n=1 Tax=Synaphobranchus kaupii TaxID=118154 RepID=A0A9Q1ELH2_SYNKA|nr:hypothetical protein SKAU_G00332740 [Synaphobranchus kaupii]
MKLFPGQQVKATRCSNTARALELLKRDTLENPRCILVHTGTNDLHRLRHNTTQAVRKVAEKASQEFPNTRVVISTLLPRANISTHIIRDINTEITRSCAALPNVPITPPLGPGTSMIYDLHLNQQGVKVFAKTLKDVALSRNPSSPLSTVSRAQPRMQPPRPTGYRPYTPHQHHSNPWPSNGQGPPTSPQPPTRPPPPLQPQQQKPSYAAALTMAPVSPAPPSTELGEIKHLLNVLCTRLRN